MIGAFQNYVGVNGSVESLLYFGSKQISLINSRLEFKTGCNINVYDMSLVKAVLYSLIFSKESIEWNGKVYEFVSRQKESYLVSNDLKSVSEKIIGMILSNCRTFKFHDTSMTSHIRSSALIDNNCFIMSDGGNIAAYLYMFKNRSSEYKKYYERIVEWARFVVSQFYDFVLEPQVLNSPYIKLDWLVVDNNEYIFDAEQFSDDSIRFIALATLFFQSP
ncbi:hypothetical protein [Treponema pedis]|uniref:SMC domain-containing protein n=1 Tax=Treponema pedis str. T A4 TaxID=1291379 RepID=S6A7U4_9SPIR|nr:hypothetical protein [Treponema pedis]AGT42689.1 SMC domain-containing protein [Treponema pedis str. T A4]QSI03573.1 hypothetical protein DYQ05_00910 [Treponema pedis]